MKIDEEHLFWLTARGVLFVYTIHVTLIHPGAWQFFLKFGNKIWNFEPSVLKYICHTWEKGKYCWHIKYVLKIKCTIRA